MKEPYCWVAMAAWDKAMKEVKPRTWPNVLEAVAQAIIQEYESRIQTKKGQP